MQAGLGSVQKRLHGAYSGKYGILTPPKLNKIGDLFNAQRFQPFFRLNAQMCMKSNVVLILDYQLILTI